MAIKHLLTRGYGNGTFAGTIPLVVLRGYTPGIAPVATGSPILFDKKLVARTQSTTGLHPRISATSELDQRTKFGTELEQRIQAEIELGQRVRAKYGLRRGGG